MTSSAASETDSARKRVSGSSGPTASQHRQPAAVGHVDVEQHDVRACRADHRDRLGTVARLADDVDPVAELGAHPGAEHRVVVDQHDPHAQVRLAHVVTARHPAS